MLSTVTVEVPVEVLEVDVNVVCPVVISMTTINEENKNGRI